MIEAEISSIDGYPIVAMRCIHPGPQPEGDYYGRATMSVSDVHLSYNGFGDVWDMAHKLVREMLWTVTGDTTDSSFQLSHFKIPLPESLRKAVQDG